MSADRCASADVHVAPTFKKKCQISNMLVASSQDNGSLPQHLDYTIAVEVSHHPEMKLHGHC